MLDEMLIGGELQEPSKKVRRFQCLPSLEDRDRDLHVHIPCCSLSVLTCRGTRTFTAFSALLMCKLAQVLARACISAVT